MKMKMFGGEKRKMYILGRDIKFIVGSLEYIRIDDELQSMCV